MTAVDPTRPERIIAADRAASDELRARGWVPVDEIDGVDTNVYDQLAGAIESIVVSTNILSNLGIENRRQRQALRDLERQMEADEREYDRQRLLHLTDYALRFLADEEVPPVVLSLQYAADPTPIYDGLAREQESAA